MGTSHVYPVWNDLWMMLGNVGVRSDGDPQNRTLSLGARHLARDVLFREAVSEDGDQQTR